MTSATGGYPPPTTGLTTADPMSSSDPRGGSAEGSKTTLAKEQAGEVGQTAREATGHVASTAADQAKSVADETKRQAQDLLSTASTQVSEQATTQKEKAAGGLRSIGDELRSLAEGNGTQNQMIAELTRQVADKAQEVADWLDQREPGALLEEVRDVARRHPGAFLIGAAVAGVVAGRMSRGVVAGQSGGDNRDGGTTDTWSAATATGSSYGQSSAFADGSDAFGTRSDAFASEAPPVTMPATSSSIVVEHEQVAAGPDYASGSEFDAGSRYGEESR